MFFTVSFPFGTGLGFRFFVFGVECALIVLVVVVALVGDLSLNIMGEVSGGKLLLKKSQAPVPLSSFLQAFVVVERIHGGVII